MIPIDKRKISLSDRRIVVEDCADGSLRFVKYSDVKMPEDLLTMRQGYYGNTSYSLTVNLPGQRVVEVLATVAHTSANCWQVTVSSLKSVLCCSYKTLGEVNELFASVFK